MKKKQPPRQSSPVEPVARMRLVYSTGGAIRYTGNLDLHRIWERALRRARLPVSYSKGFHPQPRLQLACALPLGLVSRFELADLWMDETMTPDKLKDDLNRSLPDGIRIKDAMLVDIKEKPLQTRILTATYQADIFPHPSWAHLEEAIRSLVALDSIMRERRGKIYNLRPLVDEIHLEESPEGAGQPLLLMTLSAREGATGRPDEVLSAMGFDPALARIERINLTYA